MEEQKNEGLTPEQVEMKIYERALDQLGPVECLEAAKEAITVLYDDIDVLQAVLQIADGDFARVDGSGKNLLMARLRKTVAGVQVASSMMELLVGDTAEEECVFIDKIEKYLDEGHTALPEPPEE